MYLFTELARGRWFSCKLSTAAATALPLLLDPFARRETRHMYVLGKKTGEKFSDENAIDRASARRIKFGIDLGNCQSTNFLRPASDSGH